MNEINKTLYDTLKAGTALTALLGGTLIYHNQAPDNSAYPCVVFSQQAGHDENDTPKRRKSMAMFVRAYSKTSAAHAGSIDAQIDTLLHGKNLSVSGWANFWCVRDLNFDLIENLPSGEKIWMQGAFYRIRLEGSS